MKLRVGTDFNSVSIIWSVVCTKRKLGSNGTRRFVRLPLITLYIVCKGRKVSIPFDINISLAFSALPYDTLITYHCEVSDLLLSISEVFTLFFIIIYNHCCPVKT